MCADNKLDNMKHKHYYICMSTRNKRSNRSKNSSTKGIDTLNIIVVTAVCIIAVIALFLSPLNPVNALNNARLSSNNRTGVGKQTKFVLAAVASAENQLYTQDNRLFVSGDNGIFEVIGKPNNSASVVQLATKQNCAFGGIAEVSRVIYVNCATLGSASLYAAKLTASPSFIKIYTYKSAVLPNGMTADNSGRLYVASTFKNEILRLTPSAKNPLSISRAETWLGGSGLFTNGIKYANGTVYWSDGMTVMRAALKADGTPGRAQGVFSSLSYFDDISVDGNSIFAADYISGVIRHYDLSGRSLGTIGQRLNGPSSVARARAPFPAKSFIVTERGANQVSLVMAQ